MHRTSALALAVTLVTGAGVMSVAYAGHPEVSLPGSNFEIDTDANLKRDDDSPSIDWASVDETRTADTTSGSEDESFGQGTKEDTAVPTVVSGGIPPNKSDLKFFGVYQEGTSSSGFMHLFWSRVQDPSGTTNMDFEFNQLETLSANGVTPVRSPGDLLISYDLSRGGTEPDLFLRRWTNDQKWGPPANLTDSNAATGSINTSTISVSESDGLGIHSPRTFGEASIALSEILDETLCVSFGSAYLKSRASDSFTSALKDFVPPVAINITNCGSIEITKTDDADNALQGAQFTLFVDNDPFGGDPPHGAEDTPTEYTCTTDDEGLCTISDVIQDDYWVVETVVPPGHDPAADQLVSVTAGVTPLQLSFINPRKAGAIQVTKTRKHFASGSGTHPHAGVQFTVNGVTQTTDANGIACFGGLTWAGTGNNYTVHEITPDGYKEQADQVVLVNNNASCSGNPFGGETVSFLNEPLSNITVSFESQVTGGTAAKISCGGLTATPADGTTTAFDDTEETFEDLTEGTYQCTVEIDP